MRVYRLSYTSGLCIGLLLVSFVYIKTSCISDKCTIEFKVFYDASYEWYRQIDVSVYIMGWLKGSCGVWHSLTVNKRYK